MKEEVMQECMDKMAIKEVIARYAIAVDTHDFDGFAGCFTEDAQWEWEQVGLNLKGHKELRAIAAATAQFFPGTQHSTCNHVIEVKGDKAHSICEVMVFLSTPTGVLPIIQGYYEDELAKADSKWLFSHRRARAENYEAMKQVESSMEAMKLVRDYVSKEGK